MRNKIHWLVRAIDCHPCCRIFADDTAFVGTTNIDEITCKVCIKRAHPSLRFTADICDIFEVARASSAMKESA